MNTSRTRPSRRLGGQAPERLLDAVQRLHGQRHVGDIASALVDEAAALCGAQRVLVALDTAQGMQTAAMRMPPGEDATSVLRAITPWLIEARRKRKSRLRHGPAGADPQHQRSCLVVPLTVPGGTVGHLYADIDGVRGRFDASHQRVLSRFGALAAAMLDTAMWAQGLEAKVAERTAELTKALQQETATSDILKVISGSPTNTQPVFDAIVRSAAQPFGRKTALRLVEAAGRMDIESHPFDLRECVESAMASVNNQRSKANASWWWTTTPPIGASWPCRPPSGGWWCRTASFRPRRWRCWPRTTW